MRHRGKAEFPKRIAFQFHIGRVFVHRLQIGTIAGANLQGWRVLVRRQCQLFQRAADQGAHAVQFAKVRRVLTQVQPGQVLKRSIGRKGVQTGAVGDVLVNGRHLVVSSGRHRADTFRPAHLSPDLDL